MIRIDYIRVRLPHSMESQAKLFSDHLSSALSRLEFSSSVRLETLSLPPIKMNNCSNLNELANHVASRIHHLVEGG